LPAAVSGRDVEIGLMSAAAIWKLPTFSHQLARPVAVEPI
jgi:hypothetical protein